MIDRGRSATLAAIAVAAVIAAGCDYLPGQPRPSDRALAPNEVKDFSRLYGENCTGCHGADGTLGAAIALNNPVYLAIADNGAITRAIAQGVRGTAMPPFAISAGGSLTDEQIEILVAEIRNRWAGPNALGEVVKGAVETSPPPPYSGTKKGDPDRGAKVYASHCEWCHGPDGRGGTRAGSIVDGAFLSLVSDQGLRTLIIAGRPDLGHPDWRNYARKRPLTGEEVSDLIAWLAGKRASSNPVSSAPASSSSDSSSKS